MSLAPGATRPTIVPRKVESIPGVCGTAMFHIERKAKLEAVLQAIEMTARASSGGVDLSMIATAEVQGVPLPWSFDVSLPKGGRQYVTIEALGRELRVQVARGESPIDPTDPMELHIGQGDLFAKHAVPLAR